MTTRWFPDSDLNFCAEKRDGLRGGILLSTLLHQLIPRLRLSYLAVGLVLCNSVSSAQEPVRIETSKNAKDFLLDSPSVYRIVFEIRAGETTAPKPASTNASSTFYEGGRSTNGFYLRSLSKADSERISNSPDLSGSPFCVGQTGDTYWQVTQSNAVVSSKLLPGQDALGNPTSAHVLNAQVLLDHVLNLGVRTMKKGSAAWDGDKFVAAYEDTGLKVSNVRILKKGTLTVVAAPKIYGQAGRENGLIQSLQIADAVPDGPKYLLAFGYPQESFVPYALPNSITQVVNAGQEKVILEEIKILSLEFEDNGKVAPAIKLGNIPFKVVELVHSNAQAYIVDPIKGLQTMPSTFKPRQVQNSIGSFKRLIVGLVLTGVAVVPAVLLLRKRKQNQKQQTIQLTTSK